MLSFMFSKTYRVHAFNTLSLIIFDSHPTPNYIHMKTMYPSLLLPEKSALIYFSSKKKTNDQKRKKNECMLHMLANPCPWPLSLVQPHRPVLSALLGTPLHLPASHPHPECALSLQSLPRAFPRLSLLPLHLLVRKTKNLTEEAKMWAWEGLTRTSHLLNMFLLIPGDATQRQLPKDLCYVLSMHFHFVYTTL